MEDNLPQEDLTPEQTHEAFQRLIDGLHNPPPVTRVVNINKEPYDVYIGRPSKWGNPYTHIKDKETLACYIVNTREEAIVKYVEHIAARPDLLNSLHELEGKVLGCHCKPKSCHGDHLLYLIMQQKLNNYFKK